MAKMRKDIYLEFFDFIIVLYLRSILYIYNLYVNEIWEILDVGIYYIRYI